MANEGDQVGIETYGPPSPFSTAPDGTVKFLTEPNGSLRVTLQDSTAPLFQFYMQNELKDDILLTAPVSVGDEVINVSTGHGFTAAPGEQITLFEDNRYTQVRVTGVAADAITVEEPITAAFTVSGAAVVRGNILMNVDGSGGDVIFQLNLRNFTIPIDLSKVIITMQHGILVPDDAKFGGIGALTNGLFFKKEDGSTFSFGNYIKNQNFRHMGGTIDYTPNAPAGSNSTTITFDLKAIFGQVIRLRPTELDKIVGIVRDNISAGAGMDELIVSFVGSYTEGEA